MRLGRRIGRRIGRGAESARRGRRVLLWVGLVVVLAGGAVGSAVALGGSTAPPLVVTVSPSSDLPDTGPVNVTVTVNGSSPGNRVVVRQVAELRLPFGVQGPSTVTTFPEVDTVVPASGVLTLTLPVRYRAEPDPLFPDGYDRCDVGPQFYTTCSVLAYDVTAGRAERAPISFVGHVTVNRPPVARLEVTPTSGYPPLTVRLDPTGSTDPDGDELRGVMQGSGIGGTDLGPLAVREVTLTDIGPGTVELIVVDPNEGVDRVTVPFEVLDPSPPLRCPNPDFATSTEDVSASVRVDCTGGPVGSAYTYEVVEQVGGTITGTGPSFTIVPPPDVSGIVSGRVRVTSGDVSTEVEVGASFAEVNDAPVPAVRFADCDAVRCGVFLEWTDVDFGPGPVTFRVVSPPSAGTLRQGTTDPDCPDCYVDDHRFLYTYGGPDFSGLSDEFTVVVSDGAADSAPFTVRLDGPPVRPLVCPSGPIVVQEEQGGPLDLACTGIPRGLSSTYRFLSPFPHFTLSGLEADGTFFGRVFGYFEPEYSGTIRLDLRVTLSSGVVRDYSLDVVVEPVNDPPELVLPRDCCEFEIGNDAFAFPLTVRDPDGPSAGSVRVLAPPALGSLVDRGDGNFVYDAFGDLTGSQDCFSLAPFDGLEPGESQEICMIGPPRSAPPPVTRSRAASGVDRRLAASRTGSIPCDGDVCGTAGHGFSVDLSRDRPDRPWNSQSRIGLTAGTTFGSDRPSDQADAVERVCVTQRWTVTATAAVAAAQPFGSLPMLFDSAGGTSRVRVKGSTATLTGRVCSVGGLVRLPGAGEFGATLDVGGRARLSSVRLEQWMQTYLDPGTVPDRTSNLVDTAVFR